MELASKSIGGPVPLSSPCKLASNIMNIGLSVWWTLLHEIRKHFFKIGDMAIDMDLSDPWAGSKSVIITFKVR